MPNPTLRDLFTSPPRVVDTGFSILLIIKYQKALERIELAKKSKWDISIEKQLVKTRRWQYLRALQIVQQADPDTLNQAGWLFHLRLRDAKLVARALEARPEKPG